MAWALPHAITQQHRPVSSARPATCAIPYTNAQPCMNPCMHAAKSPSQDLGELRIQGNDREQHLQSEFEERGERRVAKLSITFSVVRKTLGGGVASTLSIFYANAAAANKLLFFNF
jgi:hypothetical protein